MARAIRGSEKRLMSVRRQDMATMKPIINAAITRTVLFECIKCYWQQTTSNFPINASSSLDSRCRDCIFTPVSTIALKIAIGCNRKRSDFCLNIKSILIPLTLAADNTELLHSSSVHVLYSHLIWMDKNWEVYTSRLHKPVKLLVYNVSILLMKITGIRLRISRKSKYQRDTVMATKSTGHTVRVHVQYSTQYIRVYRTVT